MAGVEPYSPCPCGSGQKFKWCCHKVESFADKAQRLYDGGQAEAAVKMLDEGLLKEPGNPWLLTRKAVIQIRLGQPEPAKTTLRQILQKNPKHFGALILLTRCVLETETPIDGAAMFQQAFASVEEAQRPQLAGLARIVALLLAEARYFPAALRHLELVAQLGDPEKAAGPALRSIEGNSSISPWLKDRLELALPPEQLDGNDRLRFEEARVLASQGLWASAAAVFEPLSAKTPGGEADYNLGLCRLWLGDEVRAVGPIRRRSRKLGSTTEAVDLEVLAQLIEPMHDDDRVEHVQLIWPLRNREALLAALRSKVDIFDDGPSPLDPGDPESPVVDMFALLDRPRIDNHDGRGLAPDQIPRILGRVSVQKEIVGLETYDDGRVDSLGDRFTALAGSSIAPAHPRTKVLGDEARSSLALVWEWLYPAGLEPEEAERIEREQQVRMLRDLWPVTPMPYLGFRTPEQAAAAKDGNASIPLRAALCQFEPIALEKAGLDFAALRARLRVELEPAIDPGTVDLVHLSLARLAAVPAGQLDDDRLILLYHRARRAMIASAMEAAARAIVARPGLFQDGKVEPLPVYSDLASLATNRGEKEEAKLWLAQGRQADSPARRGPNAPVWDMIEVRLKARSERPEDWVPELAIILERYAQDPANQVILRNLVELGLVRLEPNPDNPQDVLLDSRPLQAVLAEYGPRVTTASGRLGVSATRPDLWTPGGPAAGSGGAIWTPGSASGNPPAGDKPKLIIPGR